MEERNEDKVFKTALSLTLYEAYEEFLSIPDFGGHKTIDAMNFLADTAIIKGYTIPTPKFCAEQAKYMVAGSLSAFARKHADGDLFDLNKLHNAGFEEELKTFEKLIHAYEYFDDMLKEMNDGNNHE